MGTKRSRPWHSCKCVCSGSGEDFDVLDVEKVDTGEYQHILGCPNCERTFVAFERDGDFLIEEA